MRVTWVRRVAPSFRDDRDPPVHLSKPQPPVPQDDTAFGDGALKEAMELK